MSELDSMLERNKDFAARQSAAGILMPLPQALLNVRAIIIGCADMRVDPADVLGLKPGGAVIMRKSAVESRQGCWSSCVCLGESVKLREVYLQAAGNFTSSYSNTPIAASLASQARPPC